MTPEDALRAQLQEQANMQIAATLAMDEQHGPIPMQTVTLDHPQNTSLFTRDANGDTFVFVEMLNSIANGLDEALAMADRESNGLGLEALSPERQAYYVGRRDALLHFMVVGQALCGYYDVMHTTTPDSPAGL